MWENVCNLYIKKKKKNSYFVEDSSPQWKETGSGYFEKGPRLPLWSKWAGSLLSYEVSFALDLLIGTELVTHCCDLSNIQITCLDFRITGWTLPMHQATRNEAEFSPLKFPLITILVYTPQHLDILMTAQSPQYLILYKHETEAS